MRAQRPARPCLLSYGTVSTILHGCVDTSLHGVLVQVACAAPVHPEPFSLRGLGSSPLVQLPTCTQRDNTRDAGSLVQPVLCKAYWSSNRTSRPRHCCPPILKSVLSLPWRRPFLTSNVSSTETPDLRFDIEVKSQQEETSELKKSGKKDEKD